MQILHKHKAINFEIINLEITVFCDALSYGLVDSYQRFGEIFYFHFQSRKPSKFLLLNYTASHFYIQYHENLKSKI